jgi:D-beta-D-heptose 7-phosphate kinase/D-beta-D-heptose 1-phosphate adenosyltransferase
MAWLDPLPEWTELVAVLTAERNKGKKIVTTNGVFDLLHIGHVRYLQAAKELGDLLVVGINSDACTRRLKGENRPFVPERERAEMLLALRCVDYVVLFEEDTPEHLLDVLRPDIHTKGGDYDVEAMPETATVRAHGGEVKTLPFVAGHSTTALAKLIANRVER